MEPTTTNIRSERGQALILFTLMLCVTLLSAMAVVDVGFFLHNRENAQQAADAAALAGAQDLPGSTTLAQSDALTYITKNGMSTSNTTITFTCTSQVAQICVTGDGKYDTIVVKQKAPSPTYFGGVLSIIGVSNCWVTGCTAQATAAGCRGACGPIGTGPADIMTVMDHSYSMSDANIQNAKDAIDAMFANFDSTYQKVGLAVTPPVTSSNNCDAIDSWSDTPKVWLPGVLTSGFQTSPHVLNVNSAPVKVERCIDRTDFNAPGELTDYPLCSCHTDLGSPIQAAANELAAHGRANVTWGMVIVTDGAANVAPTTTTTTSNTVTTPDDTGWQDCSSGSPNGWAAVTTNGGDNNGYQTTP
ncbi:MAG: vWA domain-containing protein, partial [Chloroflexota bacterium]